MTTVLSFDPPRHAWSQRGWVLWLFAAIFVPIGIAAQFVVPTEGWGRFGALFFVAICLAVTWCGLKVIDRRIEQRTD
jgi:hypothetical protein